MSSRVRLFETRWTIPHRAPLSMGFSRQKYWNGLPFPSPADLPDPGIKPRSLALQADALTSEPPGKPDQYIHFHCIQKKILLSLFSKPFLQFKREDVFSLIIFLQSFLSTCCVYYFQQYFQDFQNLRFFQTFSLYPANLA